MLLDSLSRQYWSCVQTSQDAPCSNPAICAPNLQPPDCGPADLLTTVNELEAELQDDRPLALPAMCKRLVESQQSWSADVKAVVKARFQECIAYLKL